MTCAEFLERYTDFRDGLITAPRELRRFERHLLRCAGCRRYDTAVRRGVLALQAAGTIEPSRDFRRRLDARLERERRAAREVPASAGVAAALVLAAALAMLALEGVRRPEVARAPALPPVPFPNPVVRGGARAAGTRGGPGRSRLQPRPAYGRRPRPRGVQRAGEHAPDTRRHPGRGPQRDGAAPQDCQGAPGAAALPRFTQSQHGAHPGARDP